MDEERGKERTRGLFRERGSGRQRIYPEQRSRAEITKDGNENEILQSFTTRATKPDSKVLVVVTCIVAEENDDVLDRFAEIAGEIETEDLDAEDMSVEELFERILEPEGDEDDELDADEEIALLAETQIVVSHSPLSVESVEEVVQTLAKAGGTAFLITHPHLTPIALLSWAGIDIFIRVERKVGDRIAHHASELTDRFFQMMIDKWDKLRAGKSSQAGSHQKSERRRRRRPGGAERRSA